ncbi:MAG TPA: peroxiredoxin, partial [Verrucomicrobiales bacterium]|nr:peroxiredoxin [Verrucomicrobiales bacterium]
MKTSALKWIVALGSALCLWFAFHADAAETPKAGAKAPPVEGKNQDGKAWSLSKALKHHVVLLYFYPKDDTPGCTKEACGLRDRMGDLKKDGVEVVGVSVDSAESHKAFIAKHHLNFDLLADTEGKITDAFGAKMPDKNLSRRVSFLIRKDGTIAHVTDNRDASIHLVEVNRGIPVVGHVGD